MLESLLKNTNSEFEFMYGLSGILTEHLAQMDCIIILGLLQTENDTYPKHPVMWSLEFHTHS